MAAPPSSPNAVLEALAHALSPDANLRNAAGDQLAGWATLPGYYHHLVHAIEARHHVPPDIRQQAAIQLKNGVDRYWRRGAAQCVPSPLPWPLWVLQHCGERRRSEAVPLYLPWTRADPVSSSSCTASQRHLARRKGPDPPSTHRPRRRVGPCCASEPSHSSEGHRADPVRRPQVAKNLALTVGKVARLDYGTEWCGTASASFTRHFR